MATTGKAADSGAVSDGFTAVNNSLKTKALATADLKSFTSGTAVSGQVPTADGTGKVAWVTPAAGVALDTMTYSTIITG